MATDTTSYGNSFAKQIESAMTDAFQKAWRNDLFQKEQQMKKQYGFRYELPKVGSYGPDEEIPLQEMTKHEQEQYELALLVAEVRKAANTPNSWLVVDSMVLRHAMELDGTGMKKLQIRSCYDTVDDAEKPWRLKLRLNDRANRQGVKVHEWVILAAIDTAKIDYAARQEEKEEKPKLEIPAGYDVAGL